MTALADYLGLEKSTMSGLVERAERRGLLERAAQPGRRPGRRGVPQPGRAELAQRLHARIERSLSPMTGQLALAEQRRLQTLLERLLGLHGPDPGPDHRGGAAGISVMPTPAGGRVVIGQKRSASMMAWAKACGASCGRLWPTPPPITRCWYFPVNLQA